MARPRPQRLRVWAVAAVLGAMAPAVGRAADFFVTAPSSDSFYTINGVAPSPTLTLVRGQTYTFEIDACSCHPFEIVNPPPDAVLNNDIFSGTLVFTVPLDPVNWTYRCSIHGFQGSIITVAEAAPAVTTVAASSITSSAATFNATAHPNGAATTVSFIHGTEPALASGTSTTPGQAIGAGSMSVPVNAMQAGLLPSTTYYFRAQATNATGTSLGSILSFTTNGGGPEIAVFNGAGTSPADERSDNAGVFSFATTPVGSSSNVQVFTIQNTGTTDLTGLSVAKAAGGHPADFAVDASSLSAVLTPGDTTTFDVTFSPTAEGVRNAVLEIASNDGDESPFEIVLTGRTHAVGFDAAAQTLIENAVVVTVPVRLTAEAGVSFSVPVTYGGTAAVGTDYTHSGSFLQFSAAQTVANLSLTIKDETLIEGDETVVVTLGAPSVSGVILGTLKVFTLTIMDDDVLPAIEPQPLSAIAGVGDPVDFVSGATGSAPLSLQWKKNGAAVPGATNAILSLPSATLGDAGAYALTATNTRGADTSEAAQLAVVDDAAGIARANPGSTAMITVNAKGNLLTYRWRKGGVPLDNSTKYGGVTTKTLSVKKVALEDAGLYSCAVTSPGGSLTGGNQELQVPTAEPIPLPPDFPDSVAYNLYSYPIPFDPNPGNAPTRFVCSGLPAGLTCNATTGVVSGRATVTGEFTVTVTLSNSAGVADPVQGSISVFAFPGGAVGSFVGYVSAHAAVNAELGGRIDLATTAKSSFSGKLKFGATTHPLKGSLVTSPVAGAHPMAELILSRKNALPLLLTLDLNPDNDELTGTVMVQGDVTAAFVTGWRNRWRTAPPANPVPEQQLGKHAFKLEPDDDSTNLPGVPQGYGFGTITVTAAGVTTVKGRMADGGALLVSGVLGPDGEVLAYQPLSANQGSLLGEMNIAADASHSISGMLAWKKNAQGRSARDYLPFGPVVLNAAGGVYSPTQPVLGLAPTPIGVTNAVLVFTEGGVDESETNPNVEFRISDKNVVTMPPAGALNPGKITSIALTPATGGFGGKFTLSDPGIAPRTGIFQGQLVPTLGKGFGWFLLPQSAASTSLILSGGVVLEAAP